MNALRDAIRAVVDTFGAESEAFVFVGTCVSGLYARAEGTALRATKDVDCIFTVLLRLVVASSKVG